MTKKTLKTVNESVDAYLIRERMDNEASYLARGRYLNQFTDDALRQLWFDHLRREFVVVASHRTEGNDISAELSLRGLVISEFPEDIAEALRSEAHRIFSKNAPKSIN